jgi:hypothetical protein
MRRFNTLQMELSGIFFDLQYKPFGSESRNIRFSLSTGRMNPFGKNRTMHNTWSVILTMYNLPTWLCHKRKYFILSILIQGPKQAGTNIDVFLEPFTKDMAKLWNEGVRMWDQYQHYMQSYLFASMMLPEALHYQGRLKGRVTHVLFA